MRYAYTLFVFWFNCFTAVLYRWNIRYPHSFRLSHSIWLLRCFFFKVSIIKIGLMKKMLTQIINRNRIYLFIISWYNFNIWLNALTLILRGLSCQTIYPTQKIKLHLWATWFSHPLVIAVFMAQISWIFCVNSHGRDLVTLRTIMRQAPGWVQDPKIKIISGTLNFRHIFHFFRTEFTSKNPSHSIPGEKMVHKNRCFDRSKDEWADSTKHSISWPIWLS